MLLNIIQEWTRQGVTTLADFNQNHKTRTVQAIFWSVHNKKTLCLYIIAYKRLDNYEKYDSETIPPTDNSRKLPFPWYMYMRLNISHYTSHLTFALYTVFHRGRPLLDLGSWWYENYCIQNTYYGKAHKMNWNVETRVFESSYLFVVMD